MAASKSFTITLEVVDVRESNRTPFGPRYSWQQGERDEVFLNLACYDEHHNPVWFSTPAVERTVLSGPGCAVVTYGDENCWLTPPEAYCVTANQATRPGDGTWKHKVKDGDRIVVKALLKKTYSNGGYSLKNVKLVEVL